MANYIHKYNDFKQEVRIPIGDDLDFKNHYTYLLPDPPNLDKIDGHGFLPKDQMFRRFVPPPNLRTYPLKERMEIERREQERCDYHVGEGYWFFNNGNLEWMTPHHYHYVTYWYADSMMAEWRDNDRDYFYVWDIAERDTNGYGLLYLSNRREGKTIKALSTVYNRTRLNFEHKAGIQSKTWDDGQKVFNKLIKSWKREPYYLKPLDTGETSPGRRLRFEEPNKSQKKGQEKNYSLSLQSEIYFGSANETEFDGDALGTVYNDEVGKTKEISVYERWLIQKYCLYEGGVIKGKSINTSTVEEMEKAGGKNCLIWWNASAEETRKKSGNGQTEAGTIRYFKPADYGLKIFMDKYGYSDREGAKKFILNERKGKHGQALISEIRKMPLNIQEAFYTDAQNSAYDIVKLTHRYSEIQMMVRKPYYKCNLSWKNNEQDSEVIISPCSFHDDSARFWYKELPDLTKRNKSIRDDRGNLIPMNTMDFSIGCDPYDANQTANGERGSYGGMHVMRKFDPLIDAEAALHEWETYQPIVEYYFRPNFAYEFYEDMIMASFLYGCEFFPETNKPGVRQYFIERGYKNYLMIRPKITVGQFTAIHKDGGAPSSDMVITAYVNATQSWVLRHAHKCVFDRTLGQLKDFDHTSAKSRTVSDLAVSFGFALLSTMKQSKPPVIASARLSDFFGGYG